MQTKTILTVFLLLFYISSFAQTKPTKEETVEFIVNRLNQIRYNESNSYVNTNVNYTNSQFNDCILTVERIIDITIGRNESTSKIKYKAEIPINKIEKIAASENGLNGLTFVTYQKSKLIKVNSNGVNIDFGVEEKINKEDYQSSYYLHMSSLDAEELLKAFNHLRKLCGAPEPISFD